MKRKSILITGATEGIGRKTTGKLAADGHTVPLHGRTLTNLPHRASKSRHMSRPLPRLAERRAASANTRNPIAGASQ